MLSYGSRFDSSLKAFHRQLSTTGANICAAKTQREQHRALIICKAYKSQYVQVLIAELQRCLHDHVSLPRPSHVLVLQD